MINIVFVCLPENTEYKITAAVGQTLAEAAFTHKIPRIIAECGGVCACGTCHIYVDKFWQNKLPPVSDMEDDILTFTDKRNMNSRLACQVLLTEAMDGMTVYVP